MTRQSDYHGYDIPEKGDTDWDAPLNNYLDAADGDIPKTGSLSARPSPNDPGRLYVVNSTTPNTLYIDTGTSWEEVRGQNTLGAGDTATITGNWNWDDDVALHFGADDDYALIYDSTADDWRLEDSAGNAVLETVAGDAINAPNGLQSGGTAVPSLSATETVTARWTFDAGFDVSDDTPARFGTGDDMDIVWDDTAGELLIRGTSDATVLSLGPGGTVNAPTALQEGGTAVVVTTDDLSTLDSSSGTEGEVVSSSGTGSPNYASKPNLHFPHTEIADGDDAVQTLTLQDGETFVLIGWGAQQYDHSAYSWSSPAGVKVEILDQSQSQVDILEGSAWTQVDGATTYTNNSGGVEHMSVFLRNRTGTDVTDPDALTAQIDYEVR